MSQAQIEQIEVSSEAARKQVALGDALERLYANQDFKLVILEEFLREEAVRLVSFKANQQAQGAEQQAAVIKQLDAIGGLRQFFAKVFHFADQADKALEDNVQAIAEIQAEEAEVAANV